jgi:hypothetical protein
MRIYNRLMLYSLRSVITLLSLILFSLGAVGASTSDQISFLIEQRNFFDLVTDINISHLKQYAFCLKQVTGSETTHFSIRYFSPKGSVVSKTVSCQKVVRRIFDLRIKQQLSQMRINLALSSSVASNALVSSHLIGNLASNNQHHHNLKFNSQIEHPHSTSILSLPFEVEPLTPLTTSEVKQARGIFNQQVAFLCTHYQTEIAPQKIKFYLRWHGVNLASNIKKLCQSSPANQILTLSNHPAHQRALTWLVDDYYRFLGHELKKGTKEYLDQYYQIVNRTPYFLLLTSSDPRREELYQAINKMLELAKQQKERTIHYTRQNDIKQRVDHYLASFYQRIEFESDDEQLRNDLLFYVKEEMFPSYMKYLGNYQDNRSHLSDLSTEIVMMVESRRNRALIKEFSIIGGALASCFLPVGRAFKILSVAKQFQHLAKVYRPGCFVALGLPLNSYFVISSFNQYQSKLAQVLSSPEGRHRYANYQSLSALEQDLLINTLLIGVGIGPISTVAKELRFFIH